MQSPDSLSCELARWHVRPVSEVVDGLGTDVQSGLTSAEAGARLQHHGPNELRDRSRRSALRILFDQFRGAMILLLAAAVAVSLFVGELVDAMAILAILLLNGALGFVQDFRAERAIAALQRLAVPKVKVRRDGRLREVSADVLVPGDVIVLETGGAIPADCRLVECVNLQLQEAALTGESTPVSKHPEHLEDAEVPIADRHNMAYFGTTTTHGHGVAVVTETGMSTELGRIAESLQRVEDAQTPLQRRLAELGRTLAFVAMGIVAIVFLGGLLLGETPRLMLLTSLSLAVAIVPEGLPAVATVGLALGAWRMAARQALIRRLPAVETLGSVTVICSDKTGTLTENQMAVTVLDVAGLRHFIGDSAEPPVDGDRDSSLANHSGLSLLLTAATLCNDSELQARDSHGEFSGIGDPTETAIVIAAARNGFLKPELDDAYPRVGEVSFDSQRKRMTTVHLQHLPETETAEWQRQLREVLPAEEGDYLVCTKGSADAVLEQSDYVWTGDEPIPLDEKWLQRIRQAEAELAGDGMRVLGVAFRLIDELPDPPTEQIEEELIFIGLLGMIDPPRSEAGDAVKKCRSAGIRPVMITGDHVLTASSIARTLGISDADTVLTARDLADKSSLTRNTTRASVYARVSPHDKLQIVRSLQEQGEVVAMTGDGVNDAPALKQADIGVAMGRMGTDVAKEAADMVLLDDNFATIVGAVEEGRVVFDNIRKFVKYTMTSNAGELFVMILGPLLGMPLPLLPLQILWINLVTDGLPGLALAVEPAEPGTMDRPPHRPDERIFNRSMVRDILWIGLLMAGTSLILGYHRWSDDETASKYWRTIVFTVLTISQMGNALASRSARFPLTQIGLLSNKPLLLAILLTLGLQLAVIYVPLLQAIFRTVPLTMADLTTCLALGLIVLFTVELMKVLRQRRVSPAAPA